MKRRLFIVRHAKSSWVDASLADFERPLNDRGLKAAPFMGRLMRSNKMVPSKVISSPAARARHTAELLRAEAAFDTPVEFDGRIYEASPNALREIVSALPDEHDAVMLVGHNPGIEGFVRYLTGRHERMPTAAIADIQLDIEHWDEIDEDCCTLIEIYRPRDLM